MMKTKVLAWFAVAVLSAGPVWAQTVPAEPAPETSSTAPANRLEARAQARADAQARAEVAPTLAGVIRDGMLNCGITPGIYGFSWQADERVWQGFDVALCRAVAAAVLGDSSAVNFVSVTEQTRQTALAEGMVHLLARESWTLTRDATRSQSFTGTSYYDGQGFMAHRRLEISSATELDERRICVLSGTAARANLEDYARQNTMEPEAVMVETLAGAQQAYLAEGGCDVFTADISTLAALRASFGGPGEHVILPEIISKEPFGPAVRQGDPQWADVVRWVLNALIAAEELGVTSANVTQLSSGTENPEINRLLGLEGSLGADLGLDPAWAQRAIAASGNYGEVFAANIGDQTPLGLARGLNALWTQGGLQYALPFR